MGATGLAAGLVAVAHRMELRGPHLGLARRPVGGAGAVERPPRQPKVRAPQFHAVSHGEQK